MKNKKILIMIFIFVLAFSMNVFADNYDYIDVKVAGYGAGTSIELDKGFKILDDLNLEEVETKYITIKDSSKDEVTIIDDNNEEYKVKPSSIITPIGECFIVNNNKYRGNIKLFNNNIINNILIEEYLYGVVPREIPASSNIEALKAQAVVARTFAYANLGKHKNEGFDLCTTTHCQVYGGMNSEKGTTTEAVKLTNKEYITYNNEVANTPYHASSGGVTESSKHVWGGESPYLIGIKDEFSENDNYSNWELVLKPEEIESKLRSAGINVGRIIDMKIKSTSPSGRVNELEIVGSSKSETITGNRFRTIMGNTYLKSTLFTINSKSDTSNNNTIFIMDSNNSKVKLNISRDIAVDDKGNKKIISGQERLLSKDKLKYINDTNINISNVGIVIRGSGYGHGVGMSQYGAMEMAKRGYSYKDIIKHYYKNVEINK